ncbi:MAG: hypothetical protein WDN26_00475 [Chitinophagaceae bacterium]
MSSLQDKMYNYEVTPPATSWEKIAAALDEEPSANEFPARLYNMEVAPPAGVWAAIDASLNEADEKVVPMKRRTPAFLRYAAAAVLIGAVAFGVIKLTGTSGTEGATAEQEIALKDSGNNNLPLKKDDAPVVNNEEENSQASTERLMAKLDRPARTVVTNAIVRNNYAADANSNYDYAYDDQVVNMADRYVMLMTPEGNIIRMSKKLGDLVCCVSGEEQDENCKSQLKKWQEKIASSPLAPSPDNFMDILNLVNSLDEGVDL